MERTADNLARRKAAFERPLVIVSLLVLIGMSLRAMFAPGTVPHVIGGVITYGSWLVFSAEWLMLLRVAPNRGRFLLEHKFLTLIVIAGPIALAVNLIASLPGFVAMSTALRLAPLGRWLLNRGSLSYLLALGALIIAVATISFWRVEKTSFGEALYWSTTAVTVGPEGPGATTPETMFLTVALGFLGVGFFGAVIGTLITVVLQREQAALEASTREAVGSELDDLEDKVDDAAEQAEIDNAALAVKLDAMMASLDARLSALEARLPPTDET